MMNPADPTGAGAGAGTSAPGATPPAVVPAVVPAAAGLSETDVAARVAAAEGELLKRLGVSKIEDAETAIKERRAAADAEKTALERLTGKVEELGPKAKRADSLEATLKTYLAAEEAGVPKEKRDLLDLAPPADQLEARLTWLANAKKKGLFAVEAPAAADKKAEEKPANTRAGGAAPPAGGATAKRPAEMNDAEFKVWRAQRDAQRQGR
ncbi:MAG: hypothetical protein JWM10_3022 [Myxococcaceae bacterium]|nr:hypothetical protein [Myxococcaceae bacterium]